MLVIVLPKPLAMFDDISPGLNFAPKPITIEIKISARNGLTLNLMIKSIRSAIPIKNIANNIHT